MSQPDADPKPPFFLIDSEENDVMAFDRLDEVLGFIEVPEVKAGNYRLYDATGRLAALVPRRWEVETSGWTEPRLEELRVVIDSFLARIGLLPPSSHGFSPEAQAKLIKEWHAEHSTPRLIRWLMRGWAALTRRANSK